MTPHYWHDATQHLSASCPTMAKIIASYPGELMQGRGDAFYTLLRSIVGQQISVKAADAVWGKLQAKVKPLTPEKIARVRDTTLRECGFSGQKVAYAKNLAQYFMAHGICSERFFQALSDEEVIAELTAIKGIGRWTAEMFLIFHLQRPDVYPLQDLGLIKAVERHYNGGGKLAKPELIAAGERFRPYRSVATWYLWRALDPVPVAY
jgi:DNA-3-methyladenine glycosylase II